MASPRRFDDNEYANRDQRQDRHFVKKTKPNMRLGRCAGDELAQDFAAPKMVAKQAKHQHNFGLQPCAGKAKKHAKRKMETVPLPTTCKAMKKAAAPNTAWGKCWRASRQAERAS